jgi:hypothetical protein
MDLNKEEILVKGLRKCLSMNPEAEWIDSNIIHMLLRDYDEE